MNTIYLRRRLKVIVPDGGSDSLAQPVIAALQKNIVSLGFVLAPEVCERLARLSLEEITAFQALLVADLQAMTGAHREFRPMYPDFPKQVMEMTEAALYWNAIVHYCTHRLPPLEGSARPHLLDEEVPKIITLGTVGEFEQMFTQWLSAKTSISPETKTDLAWFVQTYRDDIMRLVPGVVPGKETLAVLGAALLKHTTSGTVWLAQRLNTATDILRLATAMSDGDPSLAVATKFRTFTRPERKLLLSWIEHCSNATEDMLRWKGRWIRLGERLHPGEHAKRFPKTAAAFDILRNDKPFETFNSSIERHLSEGDAMAAVEQLLTRPGELARRLDHLLRITSEPQPIFTAFQAISTKVATPVLLQAMAHFAGRSDPPPFRAFFPKGQVAKVQVVTTPLPPLSTVIANQVVSLCEETLVERFSHLPPLGRCYVDPQLADFPVPFSQRSASKALRTLARGSRVPLGQFSTLRFFVWWRNGESRTDIDLSAALFDDAFTYTDVVSYYNLATIGGVHSGDIVNAPQGAAEFIDIDVAQTKARGIRYVVMSLNSFTTQSYCDLPECFAGWMGRQSAGSGEIFEARTVKDRVDISADTRVALPVVFDLVEKQVIWADLALKSRPFFNNIENNLSGVSLMLRAIMEMSKPTLKALFDLHVKARGTSVAAREEADVIFAPDSGITPFDIDLIAASYL